MLAWTAPPGLQRQGACCGSTSSRPTTSRRATVAAMAGAGNGKPRKAVSLATLLVHSEDFTDDPFGASMPPLYQTATFQQPGATEMGEYDYSRSGNPTRAVLERQMAALEVRRRGSQ